MIRRLWCRLMHYAPTWPTGDGTYGCRLCLVRHPVPWANPEPEQRGELVAVEEAE